ncbi:CLOCK-interacting pacemaker [Pungitius pungitius]|uniref:CLOCK-interacting pacemaker n=1 Tax=Pungitius pungitius TaxID=134920 RepID=UPI002E0D1B74
MSTKRKADSHSRAANRPRLMKSGGTREESERDSGFSDASSEHMSTMDNTDSEDSSRPVTRKGPQTARSSQLAVVGGSISNLSPMIIMNNVVLKQPRDNSPALKPWRFSPTVEVVQPVVTQPQVVFLQPVVSRQASPACKESSSRHRRPKKYLPILKSYPKIAPHPGDSSSSSGRGTASSSSSTSSSFHSSSSSSSSGSERGSSLTSNCQREKQKRNLSGGAGNSSSTSPSVPAPPSTASLLLQRRLSLPTTETGASVGPASERSSPVLSQAEISVSLTQAADSVPRAAPEEVRSAGECKHGDGGVETKRKRFCNTYNILNQSGLLDIALRTKELHRQNRRSQSDLNRLKEHTDLFLQALCSGDTGIWVKLQAAVQEEDREDGRERAAQTNLKAD